MIGYPEVKQEFAGDRLYVWRNVTTNVLFVPKTERSTALVGNQWINATTTSTERVEQKWPCELKIVTDERDIVRDWTIDGTRSGCGPYLQRFAEYGKVGR